MQIKRAGVPTVPDPNQLVGFIAGFVKAARLVWNLLLDQRVSGLLKAVYVITHFLWFISPLGIFDDIVLPGIGEVDDLIFIFLAFWVLTHFSPTAVVEELRARIEEG